ncbi:hypothetical protein [Dickeya chrysanthemi]|uniref:hypothetical protein n=1 Tax=Dickeya chrysanthemi TaxID=556 RepID=UPI00031C51CC|nr:hypothetical protein [Dickeya chrysanthemi]
MLAKSRNHRRSVNALQNGEKPNQGRGLVKKDGSVSRRRLTGKAARGKTDKAIRISLPVNKNEINISNAVSVAEKQGHRRHTAMLNQKLSTA